MSEIIHRDIFNHDIKLNDTVLLSVSGGWGMRLTLGTIKKINPKMINVQPIGSKRLERRYPEEVLVVTHDPRMTAYMLKNADTFGKLRQGRGKK